MVRKRRTDPEKTDLVTKRATPHEKANANWNSWWYSEEKM